MKRKKITCVTLTHKPTEMEYYSIVSDKAGKPIFTFYECPKYKCLVRIRE